MLKRRTLLQRRRTFGVDVHASAFGPVGAASSPSNFQSASHLLLIGYLANEGS